MQTLKTRSSSYQDPRNHLTITITISITITITITIIVEFILADRKLVSDGISSHKNPTSVNSKDG